MEDISLNMQNLIQNQKHKFRVEIRQRHQQNFLNENRKKLINNQSQCSQYQQFSLNSQQSSDPDNSELLQILISIGQLQQQDQEQLKIQFGELINYMTEQMNEDEDKIQEFQFFFTDETKSGFILNLLFSDSEDKDLVLQQMTLFGKMVYYSDEICQFFVSGEYAGKLYNLMTKFQDEYQIITQIYYSLYNLFRFKQFRNQIISQHPIINYLEKQFVTVFQLPSLQKNEQFIIALLSFTHSIFQGTPFLPCSQISKLIIYLQEMMTNAFKYNDHHYIQIEIIGIIQSYLDENSNENMIYFLKNHMKILTFLIKSISKNKKDTNNTQAILTQKSFESDQIQNSDYQIPETIEYILPILINLTSIDLDYDQNTLLYNLYKQTQLIKVAGQLLNSSPSSSKIHFNVLDLLSNIALSKDSKTQNLIYNEKKIIKKINTVLDEQQWDEYQKEGFYIYENQQNKTKIFKKSLYSHFVKLQG